jgi:hypothetical protein
LTRIVVKAFVHSCYLLVVLDDPIQRSCVDIRIYRIRKL